MKRKAILVYLGFALALGGCASTQSDHAFQKSKENFISTIEADLSQMDRRIDRFIDATETFQNDAEAELNAQLVEVVREKNNIGRKLEYLRAATPAVWPYLKADMEEAMLDLEQLLKEIDKSMSLTYDGQSRR
jgi:uncharacterized coiled-coil protein SlyX